MPLSGTVVAPLMPAGAAEATTVAKGKAVVAISRLAAFRVLPATAMTTIITTSQ
jgi:hypothetical protein